MGISVIGVFELIYWILVLMGGARFLSPETETDIELLDETVKQTVTFIVCCYNDLHS